MVFCSVETSWGTFTEKKVSFHCKANFHQPRSNRGRISGLLPCRCASLFLFLLFFSFFLSFHFFKSTFPVSFCFKMLLLQQFLLKHCCCRMYSLSMGKVLSLHIKIQGLPWTLGNQVGFKVHSCVQNTRIVQQNSERDWAQFHPLCYCLCPAPLLFHRHPTADWWSCLAQGARWALLPHWSWSDKE